MATDILVGIDVGSTNVRCCAYDVSADLLAHAVRPSPAGPRGAGPAPEALWHLVAETCRETARQLGEAGTRQVRGIGVTSVGCRAVYLDRAGRPFTLDERGVPELYRRYARGMGRDAYAEITGYPLEAGSVPFQIAWLSETQPARHRELGAVLSVADYINLCLTGVRLREPSTAASMCLWDQRTDSWWQDMLADAGIEERVLGELVTNGARVGEVTAAAASETGWQPHTPVFAGGHDYLCAALAAGSLRPGDQMNITGTFDIVASFHTVPGNRREPARTRSMIDHHVVPDLYSWMAETLSGPLVDWFQRTVAGGAPLTELTAEMAALPPPFTVTREMFLPLLWGDSFPGTSPEARGAFTGLSATTSRAGLFRAVIEGLSFQTRRMLDVVGNRQADTPLPVVGGASQSAAWMQIKANVIGMPVAVPRIREASALGAALLAGIGAGVYRDHAEAAAAARSRGFQCYRPQPAESTVYGEVYDDVYLPLAEALPAVDARLDRIAQSRSAAQVTEGGRTM